MRRSVSTFLIALASASLALTGTASADGFTARGIRVSIACKQLYHDREEVTCYLRRLDKP